MPLIRRSTRRPSDRVMQSMDVVKVDSLMGFFRTSSVGDTDSEASATAFRSVYRALLWEEDESLCWTHATDRSDRGDFMVENEELSDEVFSLSQPLLRLEGVNHNGAIFLSSFWW